MNEIYRGRQLAQPVPTAAHPEQGDEPAIARCTPPLDEKKDTLLMSRMVTEDPH